MPLSSLVRGFRAAMPLGAFLSLATLATVLAAQAQIACTQQIAIVPPMAMPGMDMGSMPMSAGPISLCPVVLILSIAAGLLTLNAIAVLLLDRRRTAFQPLAAFVVGQPVVRSLGCVLALGGGAVATMMAIDRTTPQDPLGWLVLAGLILGSAMAATVIAVVLCRCVIAIARRVAVVFEHETRIVRRPAAMLHVGRDYGSQLAPVRIPLLAAGRGLRAPPSRR